MKNVARAKWIASFDMEDLIGSVLGRGTMLSISLVVAGVVLQWVGINRGASLDALQGTNAFHFILADLYRVGSITHWPALLVHVGLAVLLYTPYVRVGVSMMYFSYVQRSWKHALLGSLVLATLTYILFLG